MESVLACPNSTNPTHATNTDLTPSDRLIRRPDRQTVGLTALHATER